MAVADYVIINAVFSLIYPSQPFLRRNVSVVLSTSMLIFLATSNGMIMLRCPLHHFHKNRTLGVWATNRSNVAIGLSPLSYSGLRMLRGDTSSLSHPLCILTSRCHCRHCAYRHRNFVAVTKRCVKESSGWLRSCTRRGMTPQRRERVSCPWLAQLAITSWHRSVIHLAYLIVHHPSILCNMVDMYMTDLSV